MKYIDATLPTPAANLACDEALLDLCEAGGPELLRFWEPTEPFVVLGYANKAAVEADLAACEARKIGVFRRCSGGGTVLQGPGCLNYSLLLRIPETGPLATITGANQFIMDRQRAALQTLVTAPVEVRGYTDLAVSGWKCSGNAQRRKRHFLLFHGAFLLHCDLELMATVLRTPSRQPDYRAGREHRDFVRNLELTPELVKAALRKEWNAHEPAGALPEERIRELVRERYSTDAWNFKF